MDPTAGAERHAGPARVVAVVVAHEGAQWLPRTLSALASQSRRPDEVLGVDTGSQDDSPLVLRAHLTHVVSTGGRIGLLDAVRAGLVARDAGLLAPEHDPHRVREPVAAGDEWVWLLHDDSAPAPDALERLLEAVEVAPSVAVAGCKQRSWDDRGRLLQTGFTVSRFGRLITGVEPGDVDQGQTDDREDVLAVGTAGMLVRRDVWERMGGGDPATPLVGDDLDLCRRVRLAGYRVVVVPGAVVQHADATRTGRRRASLTPRPWWWTTRRHAVHQRLVGAPAWRLPLTLLTVVLGGLGRMVARTAAKEPGRAVAEVTAVLAALAHPGQVWRARRRAARTRRVPRRTLTPLLAGRREVARWHRDRWQRRRQQRRLAQAPAERRRPTPGGRRLPLLGALVLAAVALLAQHRLVGPGAVSGGALAPVPGDLGRLWETARSSWTTTGLGSAGPPDPFWTTLAVLSVPFGSPALAVTVLLLLAVPLAGLGAWFAAGFATRSAWLRGWAALVWAAAPPLLAALDAGRLGALVAHLALPWVALGVAVAVTAATARRAWTAAAAAGLAFAVAATAAPVLLPAGLLALLVVALVAWRRTGVRALTLAWTALPALVLNGPYLLAAVREPRLLVASAGRPVASGPVDDWMLLLGLPVEARPWPLLGHDLGVTVATVAAGLVATLAVVALLRGGPRGRAVRAAWLVAVVGLAAAVLASRVVVGVDSSGTVTAWSGPAVSLVLAGLVAAALTGLDGARHRMREHRFGWRQATAGLLAALAVLAPVGGLAAWTAAQLEGAAVDRGTAPALPAVAADAAASADAARTLVLRSNTDGSVGATVTRTVTEEIDAASAVWSVRGLRGGLGGAVPASADPAQRAVADAVALLVAGAEDPRRDLAALGAGYVLLLHPPDADAVTPLTADRLDAVQGLTRAGEVDSGVLWRVEAASNAGPDSVDRAARLRVLSSEGEPLAVLAAGPGDVRAQVPPGETGRLLVLAERADRGWRAYLDHRRLEPTVHDGWAQAFVVGEEGGTVVVRHHLPGWGAWSGLQVLVVGLTVLLALPVGGGARGVVRR